MNFYEQQSQAQRKTWVLVGLFIAAVVAIIILTTVCIIIGTSGLQFLSISSSSPDVLSNTDWSIFLKTAFGTVLVIAIVVLFKRIQISQGGHAIAEMLGARPVQPETDNPHEKRLLNVVEEMAIAAGLPTPPVYVMDETTINAFAAGFAENDAVIGVTRGTLERLSREQLQGVVAHEFSHILHGDMRLNLHLITILSGIIFLTQAGRFILYSSSRTRSRNQGVAVVFVLGLGLIIVGGVGSIFGNMIKSAVSRQREFLADASAVQYTRNPEGVAGALKVIAGSGAGSGLATPRAEECSHLFFGDAIHFRALNLFSTHPPLDTRIKRIQPNWDGEYLTGRPLAQAQETATSKRYENKFNHLADTIQNTGFLDPVMVAIAHTLVESLPSPVYQATQQPASAYALMLALRLDNNEEIKSKQLAHLADDPKMAAEVKQLATACKNIGAEQVLPLIEISIPALKRQSLEQYKRLKQQLTLFIMSDLTSEHQEWLHFRLLAHYLDQHFLPKKRLQRSYHSFGQVKQPCLLILSLLANEGQHTVEQSDSAFAAGMDTLKILNQQRIAAQDIELNDVNRALETLEYMVPLLKEQFLLACANCLEANQSMQTIGWDFLRVVAACLGCPMPIVNRPNTSIQ
jgi:Zn-dependent protease with chaperone function